MRLLVALLIAANLGYFAWTQGALALLGTQPASFTQREPHRLEQQVRPKALEIRRVEGDKP